MGTQNKETPAFSKNGALMGISTLPLSSLLHSLTTQAVKRINFFYLPSLKLAIKKFTVSYGKRAWLP
jgi:hypothetical protein